MSASMEQFFDSLLDRFQTTDQRIERTRQELNQKLDNMAQQLGAARSGGDGDLANLGMTSRGVGAFDEDFRPAARDADVIRFNPDGGLYRVERIGSLPTLNVTLSRTANGTAENQQATELQMPSNMLAQYRIPNTGQIPSGVTLKFDQGGREAPLHLNKNNRLVFDEDTGALTPNANLTEFYQFEDRDLYVTVEDTSGNGADFDLTFAGWSYVVTEVSEDDVSRQVVDVPVAGIQTN